jgi:prophage antirepressor-like protein
MSLQVYNFGLQDVRVVELEGQPWFVAADVCKAIGFNVKADGTVNTTHALRNLTPDEFITHQMSEKGRPSNIISESGLYKLIMRSDKPEAKAFQDWVTRVVLPAIRKDGAYIMGEEKVATGELSEDELLEKAFGILQRKVDRLTQEKVALQAENARILPAAQVGEAVGQRSRIGVVDFARKLPGVNTMQLQKTLQVMQYLFKRDGHWAVYNKHKGVLFDEVMAPDGRSKIVVLEKGQRLLVQLYHDAYLPMKTGARPVHRLELAA